MFELFCYVLLSILSSFAIILRARIGRLLYLSSCCLVTVCSYLSTPDGVGCRPILGSAVVVYSFFVVALKVYWGFVLGSYFVVWLLVPFLDFATSLLWKRDLVAVI